MNDIATSATVYLKDYTVPDFFVPRIELDISLFEREAPTRGSADAPTVGLIARFSGAWSRAWSRAAARLSPPPRLRAIAALGRAPRLRDGPAGCRDRSGTLPRVDVSALGGAKSLCP